MATSMSILVFISTFAVFQMAQAVVWRDCGSQTGRILRFEAIGCNQRHRCDLTPGSNQTIEIVFEALEPSHTLQVHAFGIIGGRVSRFAMKNRDVCRYDLPCPIQEGEQYTYRTTVYINPQFPRVAMVVKWELKDDNNENVICIMVPAKIV